MSNPTYEELFNKHAKHLEVRKAAGIVLSILIVAVVAVGAYYLIAVKEPIKVVTESIGGVV